MNRYQIVMAALILGLSGCGDPVRDALADSLGPEMPGVRPGPDHRPGQPCLACHVDGGRAKPAFAIAGTTYRAKGAPDPLGHVDVTMVDSAGKTLRARSNCAGNFYLPPAEFSLREPFWVTMDFGGETIDMESPVFREGSCATCHSEPLGPTSAGAVFMSDDATLAAPWKDLACRD